MIRMSEAFGIINVKDFFALMTLTFVVFHNLLAIR